MTIPLFSSIHVQVPVMISGEFSHHQNQTKAPQKPQRQLIIPNTPDVLYSSHTLLSGKYLNRWICNGVKSDLNPEFFLGISGDKHQAGLHSPAVTQRAGVVIETEPLARDAGRKHGHCQSQSTQPDLRNLPIFCQLLAWNRKTK